MVVGTVLKVADWQGPVQAPIAGGEFAVIGDDGVRQVVADGADGGADESLVVAPCGR